MFYLRIDLFSLKPFFNLIVLAKPEKYFTTFINLSLKSSTVFVSGFDKDFILFYFYFRFSWFWSNQLKTKHRMDCYDVSCHCNGFVDELLIDGK